MQKGGQVTLFIIIGIFLVVVSSGVFYVSQLIKQTAFEKEAIKAAVVPEQFIPVQQFITGCIESTLNEAITILGLQGGFISVPARPYLYTKDKLLDHLEIFPGGSLRVPYWYYKTENYIQTENIPTKKSMELALSDYIEDNLDYCLKGLNAFSVVGYSFDIPNIKTITTSITEETVQTVVDFPITAELKGIKFKIPRHYASIKAPLGRLYNLATTFFKKENEELVFEEKTLDLLTVYDEIPFSGTDFDCKRKIWLKSETSKNLKDILAVNIENFKIKNTNYEAKEQKYYELELDQKNKDVTATFRYSPNWPLELEISPSNGDLLKGDPVISEFKDATKFLSTFFCLNNYHFVYDLAYPILVTLSKDSYVFQFAFVVIIDNNQPRKDLTALEPLDSSPDICKNAITPINVYTYKRTADDSLEPLADASISIKCLTTTCDLGRATDGVLRVYAPQCLNALITGNKEGYNSATKTVSTNVESKITLSFEPYYEVPFDIMLIEKTGTLRKPYKSELVIFELISDSYSTMFIYPQEQNKLKLIPGNYKINSYIIANSTWDIKIQEQTIKKCVERPKGILGLFGRKETTCLEAKIPSQTLSQVVKGGANFDWSVKRRELANAKHIIFYTVVDELPTTYEELSDIYNEANINPTLPIFIYPRLE